MTTFARTARQQHEAQTQQKKRHGLEFAAPGLQAPLLEDHRPETLVQRQVHDLADQSPQVSDAAQWQHLADTRLGGDTPVQRVALEHVSESVPEPAKSAESAQTDRSELSGEEAGRAGRPNRTGMPDQLKAGLEGLSGLDLSAVRVHRNSTKPAQLQALAYTHGNAIHLGPGQDAHLAHEGWHVVQQRQGRVQPTMQMKGTAINDAPDLEREADVMGANALGRAERHGASAFSRPIAQAGSTQKNQVIQRMVEYTGTQRDNGYWPDQKKTGWWSFVVKREAWDWRHFTNTNIADAQYDKPTKGYVIVKLKLSAHPHITSTLRTNFSKANEPGNDVRQVKAMRLSNGESFHMLKTIESDMTSDKITLAKIGMLGRTILSLDFDTAMGPGAAKPKAPLKRLTGTEEYHQNDLRHMGTHYRWPEEPMSGIHYHLCSLGGLDMGMSIEDDILTIVDETLDLSSKKSQKLIKRAKEVKTRAKRAALAKVRNYLRKGILSVQQIHQETGVSIDQIMEMDKDKETKGKKGKGK